MKCDRQFASSVNPEDFGPLKYNMTSSPVAPFTIDNTDHVRSPSTGLPDGEKFILSITVTGGRASWTGVIRTTHSLDLEASPQLNVTRLLVVAYDPLHRVSATARVTVTVLDVNDIPPYLHALSYRARPPRAEVVRVIVWEWSPQPWFVVVLTASGALLLLSVTLLLWRLISAYRQAPDAATMPLLQDRHENFDRVSDQSVEREKPASKRQRSKGRVETTLSPLKFDGRAHDPDCFLPLTRHQEGLAIYLNLDKNEIHQVKAYAFTGVPHLKVLSMMWNCLPGKLRALGLPPCHMEIDTNAFVGLKNLSQLFLAGNSLTQVPALPEHLEVLDIEYNRLFRITELLGTPHLKKLLIAKNCYYANPCNQTFFIDERVFADLPELRNLTLGFNNIRTVPCGLPTSLESLDLRENKISEIGVEAFANLTRLGFLNLEWNCQRCDHAAQPCFPCANNSSIKLHPKAFSQQQQLTSLSLRGNSLRTLPQGLFLNLHSLKYLDLSDNLLAYVIRNGTFFKDLKNVTTLNLIYNYEPLTTFTSLILSPHISEMVSLKKLFLSGYFFRSLTSRGIKPLLNLTNLEYLELRMNFVSYCDISIFSSMKALKHVSLSQNMLDFTQSYQSGPTNQQISDDMNITPQVEHSPLQEMHTKHNLLQSDHEHTLNPDMWTIQKQYCQGKLFFDLSQNKMLRLGGRIFKGMEGVVCLDLSYNYVSQSLNGKQFFPLRNLTYLNMAFNRIDLYYDGAFQEVRDTLKVLDLSNNGFHFLMKGMGHRFEFIQNLTSLQVLSLAENDIGMRISATLQSSSLNYLFFSGNRLDIMWNTRDNQYILFFKKLTNLTYLDISENKLTSFSPEVLCNLPEKLRTLKVNDNKLNYFPWSNLTVLSNLRYLNLSGNSLTKLPSDVFEFSPNLSILDLSRNGIRELPEEFLKKATSLSYLLLSQNQLKILDIQTLQSQFHSNLQNLTLHGNPFVCSCDTAWFSEFLRTSPIHIPQLTTNIKCGFPESQQGQSVLSMDSLSCQKMFGGIGFLCTFFLTVLLTIVPLLKKLYGWDLWYCIQFFWAGHKGYSVLHDDLSQYDAFVVFDTGNLAVRDWVYNELTVNLEDTGTQRFKICLEERDWVPGHACIENLHNAVYNSKKTVFVLTNDISVNGIIRQAFYMVQQRLLDEKLDIVVLVLLEEVFPKKKYLQMRKRLCRKSVVCWPRNPHAHQHFWNKMRAALAADNCHSYDSNVSESFLSNNLI
ncbi:toll-like receptor 9 [Megalops cyprinoides]|uniref:toll-like receptor 9 n=1 Tax=Megalops cyprinoides TaxID=118141 RepID=UPI001864AE3E|nr:toll-like receptor 9 [Megalops cyprinoides]